MGDHCLQIVTGFFDLAAAGVIRLEAISRPPGYPASYIDAAVDGVKIRYDLRDGYNQDGTYGRTRVDLERLCDGVDVVFKRSYNPGLHREVGEGLNIRPLGLNYLVTSKNVPFLGKGPKDLAEYVVRRSRMANVVLKIYQGRTSWVEAFEAPPEPPDAPQVLFLARTWDPQSPEVRHTEFVEERHHLNMARAECIRACREAFGSAFVGGFARHEHALRWFPDCVVPEDLPTDRRSFINAVKRTTVCVATTGLHGSIGWKMAEYVAASRAIVSEPLRYMVPGPFVPGTNYLEFWDPSTLVAAVGSLMNDSEAWSAMARSNSQYYRGWVRPDAMVAHTIREALPFEDNTAA